MLSNLTSGIMVNGPALMFDVTVIAFTSPPPSFTLKYSPRKPKVTAGDAAICGYNATPSKPPPLLGAEKVAAFKPSLNALVI